VSILQKAISFFLLPLYTSYLTVTDYGIVNIVTTIVSFYSIFFMLSLHGAGTWFYYEYKKDEKKIKELWGTIFTFIAINTTVLSLLIILFKKYLLLPFAKGIDFSPYLALGMISVVLMPLFLIFQADIQARQEGKKYGTINLIYFVINIGLTITFVVVFKLKAVGVLLAFAITNLMFLLYTLVDYLPRIKIGIKKEILLESFKYSLPLIPHSFGGWIVAMIDRIFLNNLKSTGIVGIYSVGFQFGNVINILTTSISQAYSPWFFENIKNGEKGKQKIVNFSEFLIALYALAALIIALYSQEIIGIMVTKNFREGWTVVPILSFSYVFGGIYYCIVGALFANKTKYVPIITLSSAAISIFLNALFVPKYGMMGSAIANLVCNIFGAALTVYIANKVNYIGFKWFQMFLCAFSFLFLSFVSYRCVYLHIFTSLLIKTTIVLIASTYVALKYKKFIRDFLIVAKARITLLKAN
jgi:O-antigen/teichoic acid export membrane protein